jgi:SAM-dependent methyltransferase
MEESTVRSFRESYNKLYMSWDYKGFKLADPLMIKSMVRKLKVLPGAKFLDVGCGKGKFTGYMWIMGLDAVGVDISDTAIEAASKTYPQCTFLKEDLTKAGVFPDESFDGIFCHGYCPFSMELELIRSDVKILVDIVKKQGLFVFVMTTNLTDDKPKKGAWRTNYKLGHFVNFFKGFDNLEIINAYTLQPHLFVLFKEYAFNPILSEACKYLTLITKLPLRVYIFLRRTS